MNTIIVGEEARRHHDLGIIPLEKYATLLE